MAYPASFRKAYEESEAEALGLSFPDFAQTLDSIGEPTQQLHLKDLALAQACCRGSQTAWELFSSRYQKRLYADALAIARNETVARELAGAIFGDLFASRLASYTGRGSLGGWLRAVLSRAYVDRYRVQRRFVSLDERLGVIHDTLFSAAPSVVDPRLDPRLNEAVKESFLALPAEQRYLLASYFFDQRTLADIAKTLGVHESTVSRRLNGLLQSLRRRITRILHEKGMSLRQVQESFDTDVRDLTIDVQGDLRRQFARE
jgi:RNA polymerase sigma-70 factor (ECF subfamily)